MNTQDKINQMLGVKTKPVKYDKSNSKLNKGTFIPSYHNPSNPGKIGDETWWVPNKSGKITKGYFKGYMYDAKRKVVLDDKRIVQRIK